jgi:hypothetical protein
MVGSGCQQCFHYEEIPPDRAAEWQKFDQFLKKSGIGVTLCLHGGAAYAISRAPNYG